MKLITHFTILLLAAVYLSSCLKVVEAPIIPEPIAGSWVLISASEGDAYSWLPFSTGLENGSFYFSNNGTAQYATGVVSMQGSWTISNTTGGYYDENGSYYNGIHQQLDLHLSDYYSHSSIDLHFDNISFYNNQLVATYFNGSYIERYYFAKF